MRKCPYTFPHRSRADITAYLDRTGRSYWNERFAFAWCVKTYHANFDGDTLRQHEPDLKPCEDVAWNALCERDGGAIFHLFCEDAARVVSEDEWTSYPGADQGDWEFGFAGRSCGWIVLMKWRGRDMRDIDAEDFLDKEQWPWPDLVAFYRGIRTADTDFTEANASAEVEGQAASYRLQWEADRAEERAAEIQLEVERMEASRPDLVPCDA